MSDSSFITKPSISLDAAKKAADAAVAAATRAGIAVSVAVVDDGGNLLCLQRMENAGFGCVDASIAKARSSAKFKTPTKSFEDGLAAGAQGLLTLGILGFGGGVPIEHAGAVAGAIGVGGGSAEQDIEAANAGIAAIVK